MRSNFLSCYKDANSPLGCLNRHSRGDVAFHPFALVALSLSSILGVVIAVGGRSVGVIIVVGSAVVTFIAGAVLLRLPADRAGEVLFGVGWFLGAFLLDSNLVPQLTDLGAFDGSLLRLVPYPLIVAGALLLRLNYPNRLPRDAQGTFVVALAAYATWLGIAALVSPSGSDSVVRWLQGAIPLFSITLLIGVRRVPESAAIAPIAASVLHIILAGIEDADRAVVYTAEGVARLGGYLHPVMLSVAGAVSVTAGVWLFLASFTRHVRLARIASLAAVLLGIFAIAESRGRVGALATAGGVSIIVLLATRDRQTSWQTLVKPPLTFVGLTLLVSLVLLLFGSSSLEAWFSRGRPEDLATLTGRTRLWSSVWGQIWNAPVFGLGPGALRGQTAASTLAIQEAGFAGSTHNAMLEAGLSGGIPAILFFTAVMIISAKLVLRSVHRLRLLLVGLFTVIVVTSTVASGASWSGLMWYMLLGVVAVASTGRMRGRVALARTQQVGNSLEP